MECEWAAHVLRPEMFTPGVLAQPGDCLRAGNKSSGLKNSRKRSGTCTAIIRTSPVSSRGAPPGSGSLPGQKPLSVKFGFGDPLFDNAGRILIADYGTFLLVNIYFPLGLRPMGNLDNKLRFYDAFLTYIQQIREKDRPVIVCGDFNVAHTDKDLYNPPKKPVQQIGISPDEREKIDCLIKLGFTDTFRMFHRESGHYTRWPFQNNARKRNFGWRLDYIFVNQPVRPQWTGRRDHAGIYGIGPLPGHAGNQSAGEGST